MSFNMEMQKALEADGEKLRQLTGEDHGPLCPRCLVNPIDPVFLGSEDEGHICNSCWLNDRHCGMDMSYDSGD